VAFLNSDVACKAFWPLKLYNLDSSFVHMQERDIYDIDPPAYLYVEYVIFSNQI